MQPVKEAVFSLKTGTYARYIPGKSPGIFPGLIGGRPDIAKFTPRRGADFPGLTPGLQSRKLFQKNLCPLTPLGSRPLRSTLRRRQFNPRRRMIAGIRLPPNVAIDAGGPQPRRYRRTEQQVIQSKPSIPRPSVAQITPECVLRLMRMQFAQRVAVHPISTSCA
jgi:hypothetical protein